MAEEKEEPQEEAQEKKPGGGASAIKALILPIVSSAITAAIVGAVFTFVLAPKPEVVHDEIDKAGEHEADKNKTQNPVPVEGDVLTTGIFHNYDPFIVSIFDREKVHYLKVVLSLELGEEGVKDEITAKNPQIRDALIFVLSDFTLRELLDNQAKNLLKEVMIKTLNKILGKGKVINIYFTEFTLQ